MDAPGGADCGDCDRFSRREVRKECGILRCGEKRAVRGGADGVSATCEGSDDAADGVFRHSAVVRSVAAAADGEPRFSIAFGQHRERSEAEDGDEENGEYAAHLSPIV